MTRYCTKCGGAVDNGASFCPQCGSAVAAATGPTTGQAAPAVKSLSEQAEEMAATSGPVAGHASPPPLPKPASLDQLIAPPGRPPRSGSSILIPTIVGAVALVLGVVIVILMVRWNDQRLAQEQKVQEQLAGLQRTLDVVDRRLSGSDGQIAAVQSEVKVMQERVGMTQADLRRAQTLAQQLRQEQERSVQALNSQIATKADSQKVDSLQSQSETKFQGVSQEIGQVREDIRTSKEELARLGVLVNEQGTLIATNATALEELRRRGEREYLTFDVKKKQRTNIAGIGIELRKAEVKDKYVDFKLYVDDRSMEHKRIYVNKPVNFYGGKDRTSYELVVNEVRKDEMLGYLSLPKYSSATQGTTALRK